MLKKSEKYGEDWQEKLQSTGLKGDLKQAEYYKQISEAQEIIHAKIPMENCNMKKTSHTEFRDEIFGGVNHNRAVIFLISNGCEWALKHGHGCTMCGHLAKQVRRNSTISVDDHIQQFEKEFEKIDFVNYPLLNIYNNGSFLNDNEIPPEARREMMRKINTNPDIKMLVLETRPEFVTEDKVNEIKELIPKKHVELAMGLEMKSDFYRTMCINKGFSLHQYDHAARIITKHLYLRTYVLLKPLFLTEKECIDHAIETIEYAFATGSTTVSLEACTIQDYTLIKYFYDQGLYSTPWLWSIIDVVKRIKTPGKLLIGLFQFYPSPKTVPHNCSQCNERVMESIIQYNRTLDINGIDGIACQCKKEWRRELKEKPLPFEKRLEQLSGLLDSLKLSLE